MGGQHLTFETEDSTLGPVSQIRPGTQVRRSAIVEQLERYEHVSTSELSEQLEVSKVTIRADLAALEVGGVLRRIHGGAVMSPLVVETRHDARKNVDEAAKRQMALTARQMIKPGTTVALDVGTSTLALAELLADDETLSDVTIVTNGLRVAAALERALSRLDVFVTGGSLRAPQHSLVNPGVTETLTRVNPSIAFIGCDGVHGEHGVTTTNFPEAEIKECMRTVSHKAVLLAAGSKIGEVAAIKVNDAQAFDTLITTADADPDLVHQVDSHGLKIRFAEGDAASKNGVDPDELHRLEDGAANG